MGPRRASDWSIPLTPNCFPWQQQRLEEEDPEATKESRSGREHLRRRPQGHSANRGARLGPATRSATRPPLPTHDPRARSQAATGALDLSLFAPSEAPTTRQRRSGLASPAPGRWGRQARSALRHRAQRFQLRCGGRSGYGGTGGSKRELPSGLDHLSAEARRSGGEGAWPLRTGAFPEWKSTAYGGGGPRKTLGSLRLGIQEPRIPHNAVATTDPRGRSSEHGFRTEKTKPFMVLSGLVPPEKRTSQNPNRTVTTPPAALWLAF